MVNRSLRIFYTGFLGSFSGRNIATLRGSRRQKNTKLGDSFAYINENNLQNCLQLSDSYYPQENVRIDEEVEEMGTNDRRAFFPNGWSFIRL